VTVHLWTVPLTRVPGLLAHTIRWRATGNGFTKLLGTTRSGRFDLRATDPRRWLLLACWPDVASATRFGGSPLVRRWQAAATEAWCATLVPLSSRGRWARRSPFTPEFAGDGGGPVLVLTRARLRWRHAHRFWRAMSTVDTLAGPRLGFGIGEAPLGWQGTVSVWGSADAIPAFAYGRPGHLAVVRAARREGWYAEELFARFAIRHAIGTVDGRDPVA
jgi:hypothetical protein